MVGRAKLSLSYDAASLINAWAERKRDPVITWLLLSTIPNFGMFRG
jgi:hypothetical protein